MSNLKKLQFGNFIDFELWLEAKRLLDFQIANKKTNRYYNTLNFFYFESLGDRTKKLSTKSYFQDKINNNLFYALENEFFYYKYTVPKEGLGLRKYFFFSYPMAVLYYSIGVYLLKVTRQFIIDYSKKNHHSFYGGNLTLQNNKLSITSTSTTYYNSYKKFKQVLDKEIVKKSNRIIVKVDIQNFFDNISISKLLSEIEENVKHSDKVINKFDKATIDIIDFYFRFLGENRDSLPQSDNNVISSFIGYLYLIFGDFIIEDSITLLKKEPPHLLKEYKIIRYVDDIHLSLDFFTFAGDAEKHAFIERKFIFDLLNLIADGFHKRLNLRFNSKTKIYDLNNIKDFSILKNLIDTASPDYPEADNKPGITVPEKAQILIETLERIKELSSFSIIESSHNLDLTFLKDVYDEDVRNFLSAPINTIKLEVIFKNFNFDLFRLSIRPLVLILTLSPKSVSIFEKFLKSKKHLTTFDRDIITNYLCQTNFQNRTLFKKLNEDEQIREIFAQIKSKTVINNKLPGYYKIDFKRLKKFKSQVSLIEQIRLRVHYEKINSFSISLSLLLNEVHLICSLLDSKDIKGYDVNQVKTFLTLKGVTTNDVIKIADLFDRRNNNTISHPGNDTRIASSVTKTEYFEYKNSVNNVLGFLLSKN